MVTYDRVVGLVCEHHRRLLKMTQLDLSQRVEISQASYSRMELGQVPMTFAFVTQLCWLLGMPVELFVAVARAWSVRGYSVPGFTGPSSVALNTLPLSRLRAVTAECIEEHELRRLQSSCDFQDPRSLNAWVNQQPHMSQLVLRRAWKVLVEKDHNRGGALPAIEEPHVEGEATDPAGQAHQVEEGREGPGPGGSGGPQAG